ncbi:hypothetical protein GCM10023185_39660 [Hymenobacter saemangeumensis]|uniref:ATPase dynein-related AAA domain-containing protein n=1 Tax=Hymenobacter saemangeumensis TaxID=1084522 RepID=A0ABP8IRQ7_9BACT
MAALRLIEPLHLQRIQSLLTDNNVLVQPITAQHEDYVIRNANRENDSPLQFLWWRGPKPEPLFFSLGTRGSKKSKSNPDAHLIIGTKADDRIVGYLLSQLPQDDVFVYLSFRMGNGEGGNNRWFGRGRRPQDQRPNVAMLQLHEQLRNTWQAAFPDPMPPHPTLPGDWLLLARLPLTELDPATAPNQRSALKTLILEKLAQAFVIAEKLRDKSFKGTGTTTVTDGKKASSFPSFMTFPLNQILYGPPGTGKTYHTSTRAVGILEGLADHEISSKYSREQVRARFEEYQQAGWIGFVTFHQAFSYEDFVEGIKPDVAEETESLRYAIEPGIFRTLADKALAAWQQAQQPAAEISLPFEVVYEAYLADLQARVEAGNGKAMLHTLENYEVFVTSIDSKNAIHIAPASAYGPTPIASKWTRAVYSQFAKISDIVPMNKTMRKVGGPNSSLQWAVFNDLKNFEAQHQSELQAATAAEETHLIKTTEAPRFVLIIDEINRGNVANIFGELITLLEDDKRAGRPEALTVKLPYSKEDFTVPENLYLLGTMNTADRSVEALDTALRRRFSFTEMLPEADVIRAQPNKGIIGEGAAAVDVARMLEVINSRLEQLLDRDHCLGHALLLRLDTLEELRAAFQRSILPLLQEYFFGDWGKIGLVLGPKFVEISKANAPGRFALADFSGYDGGNVREKPLYRVTKPENWDATAFQSIYPATPA